MPDLPFLLRYDTERRTQTDMQGFFEKAVEVHRREQIPATFFCMGMAMDNREADFRWFFEEVKGDPLFDIQDHSYTHIGIGYAQGKPLEQLEADYAKSFAVHQRLRGELPIGISICGTGGADGDRLEGFDATDKGRAEFEMLAAKGMRMINTFLCGKDEATEFCDYAALGHPQIMGFPSAYSDTSWMNRREHGEPMEFVASRIKAHRDAGKPMPLLLHDWVAWCKAEDQQLTHVVRSVEMARKAGYTPMTHLECYNTPRLWQAAADSRPSAL